jgi:uncharacterized protein YbaR (Trm112 family)
MKLIDKDALVAEIEKLQAIWDGMDSDYCKGQRLAYSDILSFLNTLEVKEVGLDFEQELYKAFGQVKDFTLGMRIAKHFFEFGLRSTITEEDCKLIWNIGDEIPNMPEEEFFKELLKRYKAQKGE